MFTKTVGSAMFRGVVPVGSRAHQNGAFDTLPTLYQPAGTATFTPFLSANGSIPNFTRAYCLGNQFDFSEHIGACSIINLID